jgi:hypothetical protein
LKAYGYIPLTLPYEECFLAKVGKPSRDDSYSRYFLPIIHPKDLPAHPSDSS